MVAAPVESTTKPRSAQRPHGAFKILLALVLPRQDTDPETLIRQLQARHRQREASTKSAKRRRRRRQNEPLGK